MSSRRQRSIPLGGRYRQVSLYMYTGLDITRCWGSISLAQLRTLQRRHMSVMSPQIIGNSTFSLIVYSGAHQRKHYFPVTTSQTAGNPTVCSTIYSDVQYQSRWSIVSPHRRPLIRKMFPFHGLITYPLVTVQDDVIKWKYFQRCWAFVSGTIGTSGFPSQRPATGGLRCFLWSAPEQTDEQTIDTTVIWNTNKLSITSL